MKTIECNSCHKKVEVEDGYQYRSCPICRAKDKARKEILKTRRKLDRESKQLAKDLKLETTPQFLRSFSAFSDVYEKLWHKKPTWEYYQKELEQAKMREVYQKSDLESRRLRLEHDRKFREARGLLRFDLFEPSNRKDCERFRLVKLEVVKPEEIQLRPHFLDDHYDGCESCRDWEYNRVNETLEPQELGKNDSWAIIQKEEEFPEDKMKDFDWSTLKPENRPEPTNESSSRQDFDEHLERTDEESDFRRSQNQKNEPAHQEPLDPQQYIDQTFNNRKREQTETDQNND